MQRINNTFKLFGWESELSDGVAEFDLPPLFVPLSELVQILTELAPIYVPVIMLVFGT